MERSAGLLLLKGLAPRWWLAKQVRPEPELLAH
jgi:hypothetical protein